MVKISGDVRSMPSSIRRSAAVQGTTTGGLVFLPRLALAQGDVAAVVGAPRQAQQIALALPGVQGEDHRPLHLDRRRSHECGDMLGQPDDLRAIGMIEPPEAAQVVYA